MQKKHNVPPPVPIPVVFENGTEGTPQYHHRCNEPVTVQAWPFEQMMQDHLLDPFMFGNKDNLVNGDNPWGKYVSSDPNNDKEVLASYWYSKTDNEYITAPDTQFLLCLEVYMDKTSKNAGLTSYAGEPFLLSVLHLKKSLREHLSAWFVRYLTRGMSNHNYHKIMDAVLEGIVATQKKGGFKVFIWMGSQCHLPDDSDTCPYFCRGRRQESRHTHLLLWWQELHSQGTQDVLVWQGGSWQPSAQMSMDPNGIPKSIEWKGGAAIGTSRDMSRQASGIPPSEESPGKGDEGIHGCSGCHVSSSLWQCLLWY